MQIRLVLSALWFILGCQLHAQSPLANTKPLLMEQPLEVEMVAGIDRFALRELQLARASRGNDWLGDHSSPDTREVTHVKVRQELAVILGVVDPRVPATGIEFISSTTQRSLIVENVSYEVHNVRWPVLEGVSAEGLLLLPKTPPVARVVAIPDADWTPEQISGLAECPTRFASDLAVAGCEVLVPTLISRDHKYSRNDSIGRTTNLTHREFIYRQAFELGRHVIGYEVQKVMAAVDQFELRNQHAKDLPIAVVGVSEGGLLALHATALDKRIDAAVVSGYFDQREVVWREPIYRNVWRQLIDFGDAELACLIAPRLLYIEQSPDIAEVLGPPDAGRNVAAPGAITSPILESVMAEVERARQLCPDKTLLSLKTAPLEQVGQPPLQTKTIRKFVEMISSAPPTRQSIALTQQAMMVPADDRQQRQVKELVDFTQRLLRESHRKRDKEFANLDRSSVAAWTKTSEPMRQKIWEDLFGRLPTPTMPLNPRSRLVIDQPDYTAHEVVLDVFPDVLAGGLILLPKDLQSDDQRPVVVCQHGLEGTPMDTIGGPDTKGFRAYKSFAVDLVKRGFVVYAPQNPYRGRDAFRTLQRKSNPLGRSLFTYIIAQHQATLRWLSELPMVDRNRIAFYGLSYGGKTAVRVPPMLPPSDETPGYCLSICSADFNEWVAKNASVDAKFSYLWTPEYEIFEWNMGHVANYGELAMLMTPRPFMVERGHDDGVGVDEWVAWEFAKVRRHYNKLGIGDRTEIEFFDGPHTINGQGTYEFLGRHLNWPAPTR